MGDEPLPAARYAVGEVIPGTVERPATAQEAADALRRVSGAGAAIVPWGAGTKQGMGTPPRAYDVALDLGALDQVLEYEPADLVVTVQAAIPLPALQARLAEAGQFLALDPPFARQATLGGTLATNASGPSRLRYGTARDLVLGLRVASPQGEIVRSGGKVVKNVVGYDLNKMHIGALGTLGVLVEVTLKVHPLPSAEASVVATFNSLVDAHTAAGTLFRSQLYPRAVELIYAGLVKGVEGWRVLFWASGSPATVDRQLRDAASLCREAGATTVERLEGEAHAQLWRAVSDFGRQGQGALVKLAALPTQIADVATAVHASAAAAEMVAHAGNGVLYVYLEDAGLERLRAVLGAARAAGTYAVVEHSPDALRGQLESVDVWGPTRSDFPLMKALKQQFDPAGTLNPGRFVGGI